MEVESKCFSINSRCRLKLGWDTLFFHTPQKALAPRGGASAGGQAVKNTMCGGGGETTDKKREGGGGGH